MSFSDSGPEAAASGGGVRHQGGLAGGWLADGDALRETTIDGCARRSRFTSTFGRRGSTGRVHSGGVPVFRLLPLSCPWRWCGGLPPLRRSDELHRQRRCEPRERDDPFPPGFAWTAPRHVDRDQTRLRCRPLKAYPPDRDIGLPAAAPGGRGRRRSHRRGARHGGRRRSRPRPVPRRRRRCPTGPSAPSRNLRVRPVAIMRLIVSLASA